MWTVGLVLLAAGCGDGDHPVKVPAPAAPDRLKLTSSAFQNNTAMPRRFSCDGDNTSPPLLWTNPPARALSLALTVEDPDAPGGTFVHWTVYGIDPTATQAEEGSVPKGARQGENSFGQRGYDGPCPPKGDNAHRYVFTLYALKAPLDVPAGASPSQVLKAIAKAAIARGRLTGRFKRG
jgi:Raf kinase inhibitor-like YbhB/YbcL family protein